MAMLDTYARNNGYDFVIGFSTPELMGFYRSCEYSTSRKHYKWKDEDRRMFANKKIPKDIVIEETW